MGTLGNACRAKLSAKLCQDNGVSPNFGFERIVRLDTHPLGFDSWMHKEWFVQVDATVSDESIVFTKFNYAKALKIF